MTTRATWCKVAFLLRALWNYTKHHHTNVGSENMNNKLCQWTNGLGVLLTIVAWPCFWPGMSQCNNIVDISELEQNLTIYKHLKDNYECNTAAMQDPTNMQPLFSLALHASAG
eukprot:30394-Amphidinium_carterae.1